MICVTRLDGAQLYINEQNIQWIEVLPDTAITFVAGARLLVRDKPDELLAAIERAGGSGLNAGVEPGDGGA
jgi:flagellar protein FlbD